LLGARLSAPRPGRRGHGRFHREADLAAALWHPHIIGVHDRGEFDGQLWIAMATVD
jgi:serine/threonine protein kinase, bacterial